MVHRTGGEDASDLADLEYRLKIAQHTRDVFAEDGQDATAKHYASVVADLQTQIAAHAPQQLAA